MTRCVTREGEESQRGRSIRGARRHRGGTLDPIRVKNVSTQFVAVYDCSKNMEACKSGIELIKKLKWPFNMTLHYVMNQ